MIYLVALERCPPRELPQFIACLNASGKSWWKMMPNTWLVDTQLTADELSTALRAYLTKDDGLLVIRTASSYAGNLHRDAHDWLQISRTNGDF